MVNPRRDCDIAPDDHATRRFLERGLAATDLERMVREGSWRAEGEGRFDLVYGKWHVKLRLGQCTIMVSTALPKRRR